MPGTIGYIIEETIDTKRHTFEETKVLKRQKIVLKTSVGTFFGYINLRKQNKIS